MKRANNKRNNNYFVFIQYTRECLYELINKNKPVWGYVIVGKIQTLLFVKLNG